MKCFSFFLILLTLVSARAEYRVFVLEITNTQDGSIRTIKSTLDPDQYRKIHLLKNNETIQYVDTWRCPGFTGQLKPLCPKTLVQN